MRRVFSTPCLHALLVFVLALGFASTALAGGPGCPKQKPCAPAASVGGQPGCRPDCPSLVGQRAGAPDHPMRPGCPSAPTMRGGRAGCHGEAACRAGGPELSATQRQQIEQIQERARGEMPAMRQELMRLRTELRALMLAETPNSSAIREQVARIGDLRVKMENQRIETRLAIREVLSPEQRARFMQEGPRAHRLAGRGGCECGPQSGCRGCQKGDACKCRSGGDCHADCKCTRSHDQKCDCRGDQCDCRRDHRRDQWRDRKDDPRDRRADGRRDMRGDRRGYVGTF